MYAKKEFPIAGEKNMSAANQPNDLFVHGILPLVNVLMLYYDA